MWWSIIWEKLKGIISHMFKADTIENTIQLKPAISGVMADSIKLWKEMYEGNSPWCREPTYDDPTRIVSLGLPSLIASEKARTALLEFKSDITQPSDISDDSVSEYRDPEKDVLPSMKPESSDDILKTRNSSVTRAEFLNHEYHQKLLKRLRPKFEFATALGGLCIKPYVVRTTTSSGEVRTELEFDFIAADNFYPIAFSANGKITEAVFIQTREDKQYTYKRLEYHKWRNNTVTVINRAYRSELNYAANDLGTEIPLTAVPEWSELKREVTLTNVSSPLFAYFKMPDANIVDMSSPLGVSGFARAISLIKDADMQYSRLLWEYEGGQLAIDIDRDALRPIEDVHGNEHLVLSNFQQRLYRRVELGSESDTYQPFAPALRDESYTKGLNTILMRIEDTCGISRGTLAEVYTAEARTATELKILKQRSYQANAEIQKALEDTLREVIYIMNVYCDLYDIVPPGDYDISFEWDDSIIVDTDTEMLNRITLQQNNILSRTENRMWYLGETEKQAKEALQKIDDERFEMMEREFETEAENLSKPESVESKPKVTFKNNAE